MQYVDEDARVAHGPEHDDDDVLAHDMKQDAATGALDYHSDWEQGEFIYDDGTGAPTRMYGWHRHPIGNEYAEAYEVR